MSDPLVISMILQGRAWHQGSHSGAGSGVFWRVKALRHLTRRSQENLEWESGVRANGWSANHRIARRSNTLQSKEIQQLPHQEISGGFNTRDRSACHGSPHQSLADFQSCGQAADPGTKATQQATSRSSSDWQQKIHTNYYTFDSHSNQKQD